MHTDGIRMLYQEHYQQESFWAAVLAFYTEEPELQTATTWLCKHHFDQKRQLTEEGQKILLAGYPGLIEPWARLHVLQLIPKLTMDQNMAILLEPHINNEFTAENKFVKAAAYPAYFEIVLRIPELREEFTFRCELALVQESPAVKSKVKKILSMLKKRG